MNGLKKSIMLYDAGGLIIFIMLFGIPFGSIFDYLWNLLMFSVALPFLPVANKIQLGKGRRLIYILFITILGIIIDWAYFELTWDTHFGKSGLWIAAMPQALQLVWMLLPIVMLWLVNFALSYTYLKIDRKPAAILGGVMALFTAPWLLPTVPYLMGWVVQ
ncbi:MAG: hypothetical protein JXA46_01745 [Dehalococcoidales bacterium]|nr:hypothetical protein [Dehalococcoidales bacterium]